MLHRTVTLTQHGREGQVAYNEGVNAIAGYHEFGGADAVAIVAMGSAADWRARHAWAVERRAEILRYVADEVIRQRAPSCAAEIDEESGDIVLRSPGPGAAAAQPTALRASSSSVGTPARGHWVRRYGSLKGKLGAMGLAAAVVFGAAMWVASRVLFVQPGSGVPVGSTVRTSTHLATLIAQMQPYLPSLHHDGSTERFGVGVLLVPLDGTAPRLVRLVRDLPPGSYSLARVLGSDGRTLWVDVNGLYGVDLRTNELVAVADVLEANPAIDPTRLADTRGMDVVDGRLQIVADDRSAAWVLDPATWKAEPVAPRNVYRPLANPPLTLNMAAGVLMPPSTWLGVQSQGDLDGVFRPGRWLRPVESADDAPREARRLMRGEMAAGSGDDGLLQIRSMAAIGEAEYRNAAFLRLDEKSEPLRVPNPESVLMLHSSGDGIAAQSTLLVSRVETASGTLSWTADTGIQRFKLEQILAADRSTAFVGTRPPVPDELSEPLLVILDHATGALTTHSLWR